MKRLFAIALMSAFSCCLHAQAVDTTVCEILKNPVSFNGKIVRVKGVVEAGLDRFVIEGPTCGLRVNAIWLTYPEGSKAKSGPFSVVELQPAKNFTGTLEEVARTPVQLDKGGDFKKFDSLLTTSFKENSMCLACSKYKVSATLVGRLDGVTKSGVTRDAAGKIVGINGFGNLNAYRARLVLQSVTDVTPQEIDYSKSAAITKADFASVLAAQDAVLSLRAAAKAFGEGNPLGQQLQRAADVFPKPHENNGVIITFGNANEVPKKEGSKGSVDSEDGIIYNCIYNFDRLQSEALNRATAHNATLVARIRTPLPDEKNDGLYEMEYHAWTNTVFETIITNQKTLTITGGYLLWNSAWSASENVKMLDDAIKGYLADDEHILR